MKRRKVWVALLCVAMIATSVPTVALAEEGTNLIEMETVINKDFGGMETQALTDVAESLTDPALAENPTVPALTENVQVTEAGMEEHGDIMEPKITGVASPEGDGTAFAEITSEGTTKQYSDQTAFFTAFQTLSKGTVKLLNDFSLGDNLSIPVAANQDITLDFNGHTLTSSKSQARPIRNDGTLILNATGGGGMHTTNAEVYGMIDNYGNLTINGGTFTDDGANDGASIKSRPSSSVLTINGGTFDATASGVVGAAGSACIYSEAAKTTITGGTFSNTSLGNGGTYCIIIDSGNFTIAPTDGRISITGNKGGVGINSGTGRIENCDIRGNSYHGIWVTNSSGPSDVAIKNCTSYGKAYGIYTNIDDNNVQNGDVRVVVDDGKYTGGTSAAIGDKAEGSNFQLLILGGTFSSDPKAYVASGCAITEADGMFTVTAQAKIGDTLYATLDKAVEAAITGDTITLLSNVDLSAPVIIDKSLIIDGGNYTITGAATEKPATRRMGLFHMFNEGDTPATLTIRNANLVNKESKWNEPCGISVRASNQTVTLENVTMDTGYYCLFVGVPNSEHEDVNNVTLNITDSTLTGYAAVYYRTNSTTNPIKNPVLNVADSTLIGRGFEGYSNGFGTIVYNGTRDAKALIENCTLTNTFGSDQPDAEEKVILFNHYGACEKNAVVTIKNSVIQTKNTTSAPNVVYFSCTPNLDAGNKVIIDHLTFTRDEAEADVIRAMRNGNELMATGIDVKAVLELEVGTWNGSKFVEPIARILKSGDNVIVPISTTVTEATVVPTGVAVTIASDAMLSVEEGVTLTGDTGAKLIVNGTVSGLVDVTRTGTYNWKDTKWVRESTSSGNNSGSSTPTPPKTETDTKTEGDVTIKSETTTTINKDGSKTTEIKETAINAVTGEKTEVKVTETVDAKTGTSATTTVKTDAAGKTAATIVVENTKDAKSVTVSADAVKAAAKADEATMTVKTAGTAITLDASAIAAVAATKGETVAIAVEDVKPESLPEAAKEALKNALVVDLSISVGDNKVGGFNGGKATVAVAYTKADSAKAVAVYYVDAAGALTRVPGATYDEKTKSVVFSVGHFSYYAVVEETALAFTDVKDSDYYYDAVRWAYVNNITGGTSAATFGPNESCTRAQAVTFLWKAAGSPAVSGSNPFTDVNSGDYYYNAVLWAVEKGITSGTSATTFGPDATCTRSQIVTFLYRYAGSPVAAASNSFTDVNSGAYYYNAVLWAVEKGITSGTGATTFAPDVDCTRGQIVTFLYRQMSK